MERLQKKSSSTVETLIKKLETLIVQDKITDVKLDQLQTLLDEIDEKMDEPDFQVFELQSIIYYARNDKNNALAFISDAISLNSDINDYSKIGALLAEIYVESLKNTNNVDQISTAQYDEQEANFEEKKQMEVSKEIKELRKKYNGNIEGWLALYLLRLLVIPFIYLFDIVSALSEDVNSFEDDFKNFIVAAVLIESLIVICSLYLWYLFLKKKEDTIFFAKLLEAGLVIFHLAFGYWLYSLYQDYSISSEQEITKFFVYAIGASLWFMYWTRSKRVIATFLK